MTSVLEGSAARPNQPRPHIPTPVKRFGYLVAAGVNGMLLWVVHQLPDWGWPGFLNDDFELVLGILSASIIASIGVNLALAVHHRGRARPLADLVTAVFAVAVGLQMWAVFPFDFAGYATDWSGYVRLALVIGIVATGIAIIANLVRLVAGPGPDA